MCDMIYIGKDATHYVILRQHGCVIWHISHVQDVSTALHVNLAAYVNNIIMNDLDFDFGFLLLTSHYIRPLRKGVSCR